MMKTLIAAAAATLVATNAFLIIRNSHPAIMIRYGRGFACSPAHIRRSGHGIELVATIEAPSEAGEVALGVFLADVVVVVSL